MRYFLKEKVFLVLVVLCLILFVFLLFMITNTISNVSAVEANGVGIYWDSNCSNKVSSIDWGTLTPASAKNIVVYIRNEIEEPAYFILSTKDWNPPEAFQYLSLAWNYSGHGVSPKETLQTTLTLSASPSNRSAREGISSFSLHVTITASDSFPADINSDGGIDVYDAIILSMVFGSTVGDPDWYPNVDLLPDGIIDVFDALIPAGFFGEGTT